MDDQEIVNRLKELFQPTVAEQLTITSLEGLAKEASKTRYYMAQQALLKNFINDNLNQERLAVAQEPSDYKQGMIKAYKKVLEYMDKIGGTT